MRIILVSVDWNMITWFQKIRRFIRLKVSIISGTDRQGTIDEISKNVEVRGVNIWMLICSSLLASLGLDLNSAAVIIGAMLISPLMSPILGVGLGVGILDRRMLRDSLKNLGIATFISLLTSYLYFFISPLGELTAELSARTTPTILDVGIAFVGGVAGIVAGSRRDKTSAIPGVAIATALMPPICTAGFGLATFSSSVFFGAFYLYFINASFIALATYLMVIWLKFPKREQLDGEQRSKVTRFIIGFAILMMIPSSLIFYNVLFKLKFENAVKTFVNTEVRNDARQPVQWNIEDKASPPVLKVYVVGRAVGKDEKEKLQTKLDNYGVGNLRLAFVQLNVSPDDFQRLSSNVETDVTEKLKLIQSVEEKQKAELDELRKDFNQLRSQTDPDLIFLRDVKNDFTLVSDISWQKAATGSTEDTSNLNRTLIVRFANDLGESTKETIKAGILRLAQSRFGSERIQIVEQAQDDTTNQEPQPTPTPAE